MLVWTITLNLILLLFTLGLKQLKGLLNVEIFGKIWGIENDLSGGLYHFKSKFEPIIEEFIGEFNIPVNRLLYKASNYVYALRKKRNS